MCVWIFSGDGDGDWVGGYSKTTEGVSESASGIEIHDEVSSAAC